MAKRRKKPSKPPTRRKTSVQKKRSLAASKGWETRRAKARSLAATKGWETRRAKTQAAAPRLVIPILATPKTDIARIEAERKRREEEAVEKRRAEEEAREGMRKWVEEQERILDIQTITQILLSIGGKTTRRAVRFATNMTDAERAIFLETLGYDPELDALRDPDPLKAYEKLRVLAKDTRYDRIVDGDNFNPFWYHQVFDPR